MLYFYGPGPDADLSLLARNGLAHVEGPFQLHTDLAVAQSAADGPVLVIDPKPMDRALDASADGLVEGAAVPPEALRNADPYVPPRPVTAGGGYVACPLPDGDVAVLVIHRRGVWDLPKGKLDPGETVEACALREVREEVGIDRLRIVRALGTTVHGYVRKGTFDVKTTHWYLMRTPERTFVPEAEEDIQRVAWARWNVARRHLGYHVLRTHMDRHEAAARAALHVDAA